MTSFCEMPIIIRNDFPVGMAVMVSGDGKQVIPIVNLDIEIRGDVPPVQKPTILKGKHEITGTITTTMDRVGEWFAAITIQMGDQLLRDGVLNRNGRKDWRKKRKKLSAMIRRAAARERREANGLAPY